MPNILVIGSANMDVVAPVHRLPDPGETVLTEDIQLVNGGKGANAAVAAARLGGAVRLLGAVGEDAFGEALRQGLTDSGVDCRWLQTLPGGSGTALILLDTTSGQNSILVGPGANFRFDLPPEDEPFTWADLLMLQLETPLAITRAAATRAVAAGALVVLDPAPATAELPTDLIAACDIITPNETELAILSGLPVGDAAQVEAAARVLLERGAKQVVVKLGSKGALWVNTAGAEAFPAFVIEPVDTTAAGDAFTGALALELARGQSRAEIMLTARIAGALACTVMGAQPSLPTTVVVAAFKAKL